MAKPELGSKRQCMSCGAKFYDLNKEPGVCPKCGTVFQASSSGRVPPRRSLARAPAPRRRSPRLETAGPELVSLDEVEAAEADKDMPGDDDIDVVEDDGRRRHLPRGGGGGRGRRLRPDRRRHRGRRRGLRPRAGPDYRDAAASAATRPRSIPTPRPAWGHSSVGRALEWHSRGRRFDSAWLHQTLPRKCAYPGTLAKSLPYQRLSDFRLIRLAIERSMHGAGTRAAIHLSQQFS